VVDTLPFIQYSENDYCIREFEIDLNDEDLKWHFDEKDRNVKVIKSGGWKFQFDNQLPFLLKDNSELDIKAYEYHRCIKGNKNLIIKFLKES